MGYLSDIYDYTGSRKLFTFVPIDINQPKDIERVSGTYAVIGADGGQDPYGLNPAPLAIQQQPYTFRAYYGPRMPYATYDDAYDAIAAIIGPGYPQVLRYVTDKGRFQRRPARPLKISSTVTAATGLRTYYADFTLLWELQGPSWSAEVDEGFAQWGSGIHWGSFQWGQSVTALPNVSNTVNVDMTGATAPEVAPMFTFNGTFGTTAGTLVSGIQVTNNSVQVMSPTGLFPMYFVFTAALTSANDQGIVDCGSMAVLRNGQPAYGNLFVPPWQEQWMRFDPGIVNVLTVFCTPGSGQLTGGKLRLDYFKRYF